MRLSLNCGDGKEFRVQHDSNFPKKSCGSSYPAQEYVRVLRIIIANYPPDNINCRHPSGTVLRLCARPPMGTRKWLDYWLHVMGNQSTEEIRYPIIVQFWLVAYAYLPSPWQIGRTALMFACESGQEDMVKLLVDLSADVNLMDFVRILSQTIYMHNSIP